MKRAIAVILVAVSLLSLLTACASSGLIVKSSGNTITCTMKRTKDGAYDYGKITVQEGQSLDIQTNITNHNKIWIEITPEGTTTPVFQSVFWDNESWVAEVPAGDYNIRFGPMKGATGSMTITAS